MSTLPKGWAVATIDAVTAKPAQKIPDASENFVYIDISSVDRQTKKITTAVETSGSDAPTRARQVVNSGDVLVSMTRPNLNAVALVSDDLEGQIASTGFAVLRPLEIDPRWIFAAVRSKRFVDAMSALVQGALYPAVRPKDIRGFELPLPPVSEQTRIADKLDATLARVDAARAKLDNVPGVLKRLRHSIIASAINGDLTRGWREINAVGGTPATSDQSESEVEGLWEVPQGWTWMRLENVCEFITKGTTPSRDKMQGGMGDVPYIKVYNLSFDGSLDFSVDPTFVDSTTHRVELKRSIVIPGDVLMNIVGPPLGKVSIVPESFPEWNINQAIARFRPRALLTSAFLANSLLSTALLDYASRQAKATAGQFNLTLEICRNLPIPIPPLEEQVAINRKVAELLAFVERIEARRVQAQASIEQLTASLLNKAFRGELVSQDPNDEPAENLLERLKGQTDLLAATGKRAKRSAKAVVD